MHKNYFLPFWLGALVQPATVDTPSLGQTSPKCRLAFSVHHKDKSGWLKLFLRRSVADFDTLFEVYQPLNPNSNWTRSMVTLGAVESGYKLEFRGEGADFAVDRIRWLNCDTKVCQKRDTH